MELNTITAGTWKVTNKQIFNYCKKNGIDYQAVFVDFSHPECLEIIESVYQVLSAQNLKKDGIKVS